MNYTSAMQTKTNGRSLPKGWQWVKLSAVTRVVAGTTPKSGVAEYWIDGDIVWITPTDLGGNEEKDIFASSRLITKSGFDSCGLEIVPPGSVVLSSRAPIGHLGIARVPLCTNQGCKSFVPSDQVDTEFLYFALKQAIPVLQELGSGATFKEVSKTQLENFEIPLPPLDEQQRITSRLNEQLAAVESARKAAEEQLELSNTLINAYLKESLSGSLRNLQLKDGFVEIKKGIGKTWAEYPVLGTTRYGVAPAKEKVGKTPERYKLVEPGTIFYNPMRINIGSIGMLDEGDSPGITSPDYVVINSVKGVIHPRWFYYWLRSPYGEDFIKTLARGAVRERMMFTRLAPAYLDIPSYEVQAQIAEKLLGIKQLQAAIESQLAEIESLPASLLREAFAGQG